MHEDELISGCISGSKRHFDYLYETYSYGLYGICLRYSNDEDEAKDLMQEGFIKLFLQLKTFKSEKGSFEGWMKRIFVNNAIDYYRKKKITSSIPADQVGEELADEREAMPVYDLSQEQLLELIRNLPQGYRTVFNLYVIENFSHKEIAAALGISESTSKTQFFKARKMLQEKINQMLIISNTSDE